MPKTYKFNRYQKESRRRPFVIELDPADGEVTGKTIAIPVPTAEEYMNSETAGGTRGTLRIICGGDREDGGVWDEVEPLLAGLDAGGLIDFLKDVMQHFGLGDDARPPGGGQRS